MQDFDFVTAQKLNEALGAPARGNERVLADGTDLITQMKEGRRNPAVVVDIN